MPTLPGLVRRVLDLVVGGQRLDGGLGEAWATRLGQIAEVQPLDAVAARADLRVDLEAALQLAIVEVAEDAAEGPLLAVDVHGFAGGPGRGCTRRRQKQRSCTDLRAVRPHHVANLPRASAVPAPPAPPP